LITGFLVQGLRIHSLKNGWETWSLGGWVISEAISGLSPQESSLLLLHRVFWWVHLFLSFGLIAYIPFSKLLHLVTSPANILFRATTPPGALVPIRNFSEPYSFGVSRVEDFTRSQIFDFDACTEWRCQTMPAHLRKSLPLRRPYRLKEKWLSRGKKEKGRGPLTESSR
jgi:hypothetical protein